MAKTEESVAATCLDVSTEIVEAINNKLYKDGVRIRSVDSSTSPGLKDWSIEGPAGSSTGQAVRVNRLSDAVAECLKQCVVSRHMQIEREVMALLKPLKYGPHIDHILNAIRPDVLDFKTGDLVSIAQSGRIIHVVFFNHQQK